MTGFTTGPAPAPDRLRVDVDGVCVPQGPGWTEKPVAEQVDDCVVCPVRFLCLGRALQFEAGDNYASVNGVVYGGLTGRQRAQLLKAYA